MGDPSNRIGPATGGMVKADAIWGIGRPRGYEIGHKRHMITKGSERG